MYDMKPRQLQQESWKTQRELREFKVKFEPEPVKRCSCTAKIYNSDTLCFTCRSFEDGKPVLKPGLCPCGKMARAGRAMCKPCQKKAAKQKAKIASEWKKVNAEVKKRFSKISSPYRKRNRFCRDMGFKTYAEYLASNIWKSIRDRVLSSSRACVGCGKRANQVHHSEYTRNNLSGTTLDGLHPICGTCHKSAEYDKTGNKRSIAECNKILGIG